MNIVDQAFILALAINAAWVANGLFHKKIMWKWIVVYWSVLTAKNVCNLIANFI